MWEGRKMTRRVVILEEKIEKVQINVAETKVKYDKAVDELEKLLMKRKERDNKQLLKAFSESEKTLAEVIEFLQGNGQTNTIVRNTEETTDEDGDTTQTITYTWNGEEVDKTEASTLYSSAVTMTAQSKDFAYEKTGEDELVLVMHTDDGDYTVSFSPYDSSFYYVVDLEGVPSLVNKNNVNSLIDAYLTVIGEK